MRVFRHTFRTFRQGVAVGMLLLLTGGHWGLLQVVAWTRMAIVYSRSESMPAALSHTFDGRHPCALCKLIRQTQPSPRQAELQQTVTRLDTPFAEGLALRLPEPPDAGIAWTADAVFPWRSDPPPVPPPRHSQPEV